MRAARYFVFILCLFCSLALSAQKEDWLPVTPADLQLKQVPDDPGAPAIQLYYADYIDNAQEYEFIYHRIKILAESGKKYADVEITGGSINSEISGLKARTIHPDGTIVEFTGKPFNKTVFKGRGFKLNAKTFTFPDVTVGSIVEYRYRTVDFSNQWVLQHPLYTVREFFTFHPFHSSLNFSYVSRNLKELSPTKTSDGWELEWKNVPAFQTESQMPPEQNYKPTVSFFYTPRDLDSQEKYWRENGKSLYNDYEKAIGNRKEIREAAMEAIGNETDPEKKLRKLYQRAQQIRNLSYERARDEQERKKEKLKENTNLGDLIKRGYGDNEDITAFFIGMARAAGFDAQMLLVSNRRNAFFSPKVLNIRALTGRAAIVKLNGNDVYLQPGVRFCPYGLMRWANTSTEALRFDKKGGSFVLVPPLDNTRSLTRRTVKATLAEDGSLTGEITLEFQGEEALEHRLDAIESDDAGKKKDLESEMQAWLPTGAIVKLTSAQGWEAPDDPLIAKFDVTIPSYSSSVGKRLLLPWLTFQSHEDDAFKHSDRKYPIYYPYAFSEHDRMEIKLPAGYTVESMPPKQDIGISYARYQIVSATDGKILVLERALGLNAIMVPLTHYPELKDFMGKIHASDEQQMVMHTEASKNAQKTN
ncbi:MAG TPA: DUF3857 domain-containing protein [Candidatus Angelobacter sp.]|nr:DUF3857 domain-containing protein [Candidatus Angelobacter sp.]